MEPDNKTLITSILNSDRNSPGYIPQITNKSQLDAFQNLSTKIITSVSNKSATSEDLKCLKILFRNKLLARNASNFDEIR